MSEFVPELDDCVVDPADIDWSAMTDARLMVSVRAGTPQALIEATERGLI